MSGYEPYVPPSDLEYNEFVGEIRPLTALGCVEMHFRYGVKDDRYLDWKVSLNERIGGLSEFRAGDEPLPRRPLEVIEVSDSAIIRTIFDPEHPQNAPKVIRLSELRADDHTEVDYQYQNQINRLCVRWQRRHPQIVDVVDRHNTATMGFLAKDREVQFREGPSFGWVRNTVVCLDTDLADMVISDRVYHYFPTVESTAAVLLPHNEFKFIWTAAGQKTSPEEVAAAKQDDDGPMIVQGDATMGMIVASIYAGDWSDNLP
jgi:hypothetical protein